MSTKRYYWIKVSSEWFQSPEVKVLRKLPGGDTYALIYLEMMVLSAPDGGYIYFDHMADNFAEELAIRLDEKREAVSILLGWLESKHLISEGNTSDILHFDRIDEMTGSETDAARRMRLARKRRKEIVDFGESQKQISTTETGKVIDNSKNFPQSSNELKKEVLKDTESKKNLPKKRNNVQKCSTSRVRARVRARVRDRSSESTQPSSHINLQQNFDTLWDLFPKSRQVGKQQAFKAYQDAIQSGTEEQQIFVGTKNYLQFVENRHYQPAFIKLGSNFFFYETWKSYVDLPQEVLEAEPDSRKIKEHLPDWAINEQENVESKAISTEEQKRLKQRIRELRARKGGRS